ncbi:MAG: bifunctional folylpolyglutamate synthase/dihydrofolate synthase [Planctomycetes bacterium]|nr:bifunctional folylpolyglutamate synthase/dihydrofolate synthase [Planctomycetota bacterium]
MRTTPRRKDPEGKRAAALAFNAALGDPQRAYRAVQVAGTSGKGSVSGLIASALSAGGTRAGLHVSPYVQAFTEKTWVDGALMSAEAFAAHVETLRPHALAEARRDGPASVHGLASLAVSYLEFARQGAELAVQETGVGGRYDLTQGLDLALSVITDLGLDHVQSLGPTLERIAWHKAGIQRPGVPCVAVEGPGFEVVAREAEAVGAPLVPVRPAERVLERDGARALLQSGWGPLELTLPAAAPFWARNAAVALAALEVLAEAGWPVGPEAIQRGFARQVLPGRLEALPGGLLLDGAHNPQKAAALAAALPPGRIVAVLGSTGHRPPTDVLEVLAPRLDHVVATAPQLYGKEALPGEELAAAARSLGLSAEAAPDVTSALELAQARREGGTLLVTGSLYLVGEARGTVYPLREVVLQRTCWPRP